MNETPSKDKAVKLVNRSTISQLKVELDPNKPITVEQQHEQSVAIYDILDENYFSLEKHVFWGKVVDKDVMFCFQIFLGRTS